jgi:hypothetical protein
MTTITATVPAFTLIHLPNPEVDYEAALGELTQILDAHRTDDYLDFMSFRIYRRATPVFQAAYTNGTLNPNRGEVARVAHAFVDALDRDILVNPLSFNLVTRRNNPVINPQRERDWVWERTDHEECRALFPQSPLDGGEMLAETPPHLLARRMRAWATRWFPDRISPMPAPEESTPQVSTLALPRNPMATQMRRMVYMKLCNAALFQRRNQEDRLNIEDQGAWLEREMAKIRELSARAVARAQEESTAAEEALRSRIESENRSHTEALSSLQNQISAQNAAHQADLSVLNAQIALLNQTDAAAIAQLNAQIAESNETHRADTAGLHERIDALNLSHETQVTSLEGQLTEAVQQHTVDVTSIRQAEARVAALANELAQARTQLQDISLSLATQQAQNARNSARTQQLEQQYAAAQYELRQLAERVNNQRSRHFCSIS